MKRKNKLHSVNKSVLVVVFLIIIVTFVLLNVKKDAENDYNIILISLTNVGANHLGLYGYERNTSPNIDAFAEESLVFDNFFTHASWTLPSGISLFTSLYPYQHKVMDRSFNEKGEPEDTLSSDIITLIDLLNDNGYVTGAFTGGFDYRPIFGLTNRFDFYFTPEEKTPLKGIINSELLQKRRLGHMVNAIPDALEWINNHKKKKFFLFLQGYDTHCPFSPKQPYDKIFVNFTLEDTILDPAYCYRSFNNNGTLVSFTTILVNQTQSRLFIPINLSEKELEFLEAQYDAEIRYVDDNVGNFINELKNKGILDNTIIILLSEHGEMFAKNGRFGRAGRIRGTLYDDVVHVPLIILHPEFKPDRTDEFVQIIDIMPTLLDFVGIPIPMNLQGKSILPLIKDNEILHEEIYGGSVYGKLIFEFYEYQTINEFIRNKEFKLIHEIVQFTDGSTEEIYELYDLSVDKAEQNNIASKENGIVDELKEKLGKWSKKMNPFIELEKNVNVKKALILNNITSNRVHK